MFTERTSVGLDVHARSVVAHAMDIQTGEIFKARLCPDPVEVTSWIKTLPGPAAAIYEAGPTGYGLARTLLSNDIRTVVAAPSKLQRPSAGVAWSASTRAFGPVTPATNPAACDPAARGI